MRIIFAGGGTGGHINPAVAIANRACERYENAQILFVGTEKGLEREIVPKSGYNIEFIEAEGLRRSLSLHNIRVVLKTLKGYMKARRIIKDFKPDVVIGTGGYVSGPVVLAAHFLKIPTLIHEQNALAGITSRMLSKYADRICLAFNDKNILGHPEKSVVTGNPVRSAFKNANPEKCRKELAIDDGIPFVLCISGSLGAQKINNSIIEYLKANPDTGKLRIMIVSGERYYEEISGELKKINNPNVYVKKFVYDMEKYLAAADLVISRSGALSLSEIAYMGKPSILIPSPNVAENHQEFNADMFVRAGCAVKISEAELTCEKFKETLDSLINDKARLAEMAAAAHKEGIRNGDDSVLDEAESIIHLSDINA